MSKTKGRADLLVEVGTEELPPAALRKLSEAFASGLAEALATAGLVENPTTTPFASPRRLAVRMSGVARKAADQESERRGPAVSAAYDENGQPTPAATGFARSCGVEVADLKTLSTDKGEWLVHRSVVPGANAKTLIGPGIQQALDKLPIPKRMRWGTGTDEFVRPVHWLVVLHGQQVVPCSVLGVAAGRVSRGHRFMGKATVRIASASDYEQRLQEEGAVMPDFAARSAMIEKQITRLGEKAGGHAVIDAALLETVTALVEKPHAVLGSFDSAFLKVPQEALISSMRDHQKYFHVVDKKGALLPAFITISNIKSRSPARVRTGNERVLNARLADAKFFWESDATQTLAQRAQTLDQVLFHHALGSLADKTRRIERLAGKIARAIGASEADCSRGASLCKADLVSGMVGEFPDLQGTMGRYLAKHDGESAAVARAVEEHYLPRQAGGALPKSVPGQVLALADRLDSLVGLFIAGEEPTGEKDPYGLRRAALGVIRILVEKKLDLDVATLVEEAADGYVVGGLGTGDSAKAQCTTFILERYRSLYVALGFAQDEISAVLEAGARRPLDFDRRLKAVSRFRHHRDAPSLTAANKRIRNILRKSEESIPAQIDAQCLSEPAEIALSEAIIETAGAIAPAVAKGDYPSALRTLAGLRPVVDSFFDKVMVMAPDPAVRANRLALLGQLNQLFLGIADISWLQTGETGDG